MTLHQGETTFEQPLIYPDNDFRKEYHGAVKNGHVMHGQGTLTLKNGKCFTGEWVSGTNATYATDIQNLETEWKNLLVEHEKK